MSANDHSKVDSNIESFKTIVSAVQPKEIENKEEIPQINYADKSIEQTQTILNEQNILKTTSFVSMIDKVMWKQSMQFKCQVFYKLQMLEQLSKSQQKLKQKYSSRYSTLDGDRREDLTTQ